MREESGDPPAETDRALGQRSEEGRGWLLVRLVSAHSRSGKWTL